MLSVSTCYNVTMLHYIPSSPSFSSSSTKHNINGHVQQSGKMTGKLYKNDVIEQNVQTTLSPLQTLTMLIIFLLPGRDF